MKEVKKNAFVAYHQWDEPTAFLTDEEFGRLMRAVFHYSRTQEMIDLPPHLRMAFGFIVNDLDANFEKWNEKRERCAEAGRKSAEKKKSTDVDSVEQDATDVNIYECEHSCDIEIENGGTCAPLSLSQQKFIQEFPHKVVDCGIDDKRYDIARLCAKIHQSTWLSAQSPPSPYGKLSGILDAYKRIMADKFADFTDTKKQTPADAPTMGVVLT